MKVLLSWLHDFLPTKPSVAEVEKALLSVGIEVSNSEFLGKGFEQVFIAKILESQKHPNADRLSFCKVSDGKEIFEIVCGAKNFKNGDLTPLAKVGANLPNGMTIQKSKIRGVASHGMLCSESELGLVSESEGILILPPEAPVGENFGTYLGREDWVLTLELTPNRGDCLSITGVAREVAAALGVSPSVPEMKGEGNSKGSIKVNVLETLGSPRYVLHSMDSIQVGPSTSLIQRRLQASGVRPINNVVDVTNYVLLERGQPLHVFDRDKVVGFVEVRNARSKEKILCLDDVERSLDPTDLVIADQEGPIAIAGIIGGIRTAVTPKTQSILLESAHFHPRKIRCTARRLFLHTEASHRFERWVDPGMTWSSSLRAIELLRQNSSAILVASIDIQNGSFESKKFQLRKKTLHRILGEEVPAAGEYLSRLGFSVEKTPEGWNVDIPSRRSDLTREIDLVEEVARIHGYEKIQPVLSLGTGISEGEGKYEKCQILRSVCRSLGFYEIFSYSFLSETQKDLFSSPSMGPSVKLSNALTSDSQWMRQTLLPGLLQAWKYNQARQGLGIQLFEIGKVFEKAKSQSLYPCQEETHLSFILAGEIESQEWFYPSRRVGFFDGKGIIEKLMEEMGLSVSFEPSASYPFLHPQQSSSLVFEEQNVGFVGLLHPKVSREWDTQEVVVGTLFLDRLLPKAFALPRFQPLSSFPTVQRDLALVLPSSMSSKEVLKKVQEQKLSHLQEIRIFDVYEGKGIPQGFRSVAFRLTFGSMNQTLTDSEVDAAMQNLVHKVTSSLGVQIRG